MFKCLASDPSQARVWMAVPVRGLSTQFQRCSMRKKIRFVFGVVLLLAVHAAGGCGHKQLANNATSTSVQSYRVRGVVKEFKPDGKTVVVRHEAITNYMAAMTMPFEARDPQGLAAIQVGDTIDFRLQVTENDGWIDQITVVGNSAPGKVEPVELVNVLPNVPELKAGDLLPNYSLTNELGRVTSLDSFRGQVLGLSFIFTRCPFPTFCLRMTQHFGAVQRSLKSQAGLTNWHLLTISFDPEY